MVFRMTSLPCPHCGQPIINDPAIAGKLVECPGCKGVFQVPVAQRVLTPEPTGLKGRFNILHYILAAGIGLFIGGCGGCVIGSGLMVGTAADPTIDRSVGRFGGYLLIFGPFLGASFMVFLLRAYDANRTKRGR